MSEQMPPGFLELLRAADTATLENLYDQVFPMIAAHVRQNGGNTDDARDVFQEALIALLESAKRPDFTLTASPSTYLFAVSRNLWLKQLRSNKGLVPLDDMDVDHEHDEVPFELIAPPTDEEKSRSILEVLTDNCWRLLNAIFFVKEPMTDLMARMGWKNKHTADNQKYKCIHQARKAALRQGLN